MEQLEYWSYVTLNKQAILKSTECACIFCFKKFKPEEIQEFCCDNDVCETAICPYCQIDAIVPNYLVNYNDDDLKRWHKMGFGRIQ
jgi:hypothetical protein